MQPKVPFYKRLRFAMMLTVLLLITLISGTSILISYYVTGQKILKDIGTEFVNSEAVTETFFRLADRHLRLVAEVVAEELMLRQQLHEAEHNLAPAETFRIHEQENEVDFLFLADSQGGLAEAAEGDRAAVLALLAHQELPSSIRAAKPFSLILLDDAGRSLGKAQAGKKQFIMLAGVPVLLPQKNERCVLVSGTVLNSDFLRSFPVHPHMAVSLVSDNEVLATTLPADLAGRNGATALTLLPGAMDLVYEGSFFREKMYMKTRYIPGLENSTTNVLVLARPIKLMLATEQDIVQHFLIIFFLGLCASIILVFFITGSVLNPLNDLKLLVEKISSGSLDNRIEEYPSVNEFTPLINAFNNMLDLIQKKDEELLDRVAAKTYELRQQNIFIDNLLRSSPVMAIAATDMNQKITYFNPVAERLFGYRANEVIGKPVTAFHAHIKNRETEFNRLIEKTLIKGSHTFTVSTADFNTYDLDGGSCDCRPKHGYLRTIEVYLSPIRAQANENATGLMMIAQDITKARQMDERLHAALAELQVILDNTTLGLALVQNDWLIRVNNTFERMFGYRFEEIRAKSWNALRASLFAGTEAECWDGSGRMSFMVGKTEPDAEPQPFWCKVRQVVIDGEQERRRELFLFEDMSIQNEMFEKIQRLSQAVEQSSNSVVIADVDGTIEYVNRTFITTNGYGAEEVLGRSLSMLAPDSSAAAIYDQIWTAVRSGREWTGELVNKKKSGELYEESVVVSPIRNEQDEITHVIMTKENITDLKRARQQADSANRAKSEFLAKMSHEIRTPMNSIIGMTELLLDTELLPEQRSYLENVNSSASVLLSLINDILDFSKIEAGKLELDSQPFSPRQLAEEIVGTLNILAEQKGIELRLEVVRDDGCLPLGDSLRIRQVLLNLVGNAVKFTNQGHVVIELDLKSESEDICLSQFRIIDTGIGIAKDQQDKIFADFTQADNSITRDFGGTGLGLSISSRLLQLMNSSIVLESTLGKGSIFSFTLRLQKGAQAAMGGNEEEPYLVPAGSGLELLLVEDNPANQQLAVIMLKKLGHQVTVANNGLEALACLSERHYDLVFMDMQMPVMDGLTATRHIRLAEQSQPQEMTEELAAIWNQLCRRLQGGHVCIVAVTANAMQEDRQQCLAAGMDEYISKPYKKLSLISMLQKFGQKGGEHLPQHISPPEPPPDESAGASWESIRQHIIAQFELDAADAEEVLSAYAETLNDNADNLQQLIDNGDGTAAGRQAHALKGGLLNLGLERLAKSALILEKELPKRIEARHRQMTDRLVKAIKQLTAEAQAA